MSGSRPSFKAIVELELIANPDVKTRRVGAFVTRTTGSRPELVDRPMVPRGHGQEWLRSTRRALGLYLNEAARALGISTADLSACERGLKLISSHTREQVERALYDAVARASQPYEH